MLTQALFVIAAFVAVGLPHQGGPGAADSFLVRAWDVIASSGSTIVTADIGGDPGTGGAAEAPATVESEPLANPIALLKGGGPLANGVPISIVLITGLGLMIGGTLFKVARLSSGS
jgi:hypothetical protein